MFYNINAVTAGVAAKVQESKLQLFSLAFGFDNPEEMSSLWDLVIAGITSAKMNVPKEVLERIRVALFATVEERDAVRLLYKEELALHRDFWNRYIQHADIGLAKLDVKLGLSLVVGLQRNDLTAMANLFVITLPEEEKDCFIQDLQRVFKQPAIQKDILAMVKWRRISLDETHIQPELPSFLAKLGGL